MKCSAYIVMMTAGMLLTAASAAGQEVKTVKSKDGTAIAYAQFGEGPALILVGGALSNRAGQVPLAQVLSPRFAVISYDRRGRGDSGDTPPYAVQHEIQDIEALIDALGGSAFLFGSSSGAVLSLEAATQLPDKVKKAVLFEPPLLSDNSRPPLPADLSARIREMVSSDRRSDAVELFMTTAVGVPADGVAQMKQSPMWPAMQKVAHTLPYDLAVVGDLLSGRPLPAERWKAAKLPILVLDGEKSDAWLRSGAMALAKVLPNARHQTLEGLDHGGPFLAPERFAPVVSDFLLGEARGSNTGR